MFSHDPLQVVVYLLHHLAQLNEVNLSDLTHEPLFLSSSDFSVHDEIVKKCSLVSFQPKITLETSQRELMVQTVAINLGIALMPKNVCDSLSPNLVHAVPLVNPEIVHSMSVIWKKGRPLSYPVLSSSTTT